MYSTKCDGRAKRSTHSGTERSAVQERDNTDNRGNQTIKKVRTCQLGLDTVSVLRMHVE